MSDEMMLAAIDALERAGLSYMIVGSISSNVYAFPRSTNDADFVVQLVPGGLQRVLELLGPSFELEPQTQFEGITATIRYVIRTPEVAFRIDLFLLSDDPFDQERFARRRRMRVLGRETYAPTAEDVVIQKLRWSRQGRRSKDVDDVRNVLAVRRRELDWAYVEHWCDLHGTRALLDEIRASLPPAEEL